MDLFYMGLMYREQDYEEIMEKSKVGLSVAANVFQYNLLKGLKECGFNRIPGVNSFPVGTWPKQYKQLFLTDKKIELCGNEFSSTPTINVPGIKQWVRYISTEKILSRYLKKCPKAVILTYNFYFPYYSALIKIKKRYPNIHICTIITDLPNEYGINYETGIKGKMIDYIGKKSMSFTEISDSFVLLTEEMKVPLKINDRPYTVVEGFAQDYFKNIEYRASEKKHIVYTGTLNREFGVGELISAFETLNFPKTELHLYGKGNLEKEIKKKTINHSNIKYFGMVERSVALAAQKNATILVNPRSNDMFFTKYSFPSKTMEYLSSGRPLVAYMLDGMPKEYEKYIYVIDQEKNNGMLNALKNALNDTEKNRMMKGNRARNFVLNEKNTRKQVQKIVDLLNTCQSKTI